jgi:hypothetical protein
MLPSSAQWNVFFADLRQLGMDIGPLEITHLNEILFALEVDNRTPHRLEELSFYIAPLFCRSIATQRQFGEAFARWAAAVNSGQLTSATVRELKLTNFLPNPDLGRKRRQLISLGFVSLAVAALLLSYSTISSFVPQGVFFSRWSPDTLLHLAAVAVPFIILWRWLGCAETAQHLSHEAFLRDRRQFPGCL